MIALLPGGLELAYDEAGSGMPLLLVHGWPHDRTMWTGQLGGLATYARADRARPARRRRLDRARPVHDRPVRRRSRRASSMRSASRAPWCAGSRWAGTSRSRCCAAIATAIRGLILADTRATADTDEVRANRMRADRADRAAGDEALAARQLERRAGAIDARAQPPLRGDGAPHDGLRAGGGRDRCAARDGRAPRLDADCSPTIDVPTLVVGGAEDTLHTARRAARDGGGDSAGAAWRSSSRAGTCVRSSGRRRSITS